MVDPRLGALAFFASQRGAPVIEELLVQLTQRIDWQALAAIGTFLAVLVALFPIWRNEIRRRAQARNLRFRLASQLMLMRPFYLSLITEDEIAKHAAPDEEQQTVILDCLQRMMIEASALEKDEQDLLGVFLLNLTGVLSLWKAGKRDVYLNVIKETAPLQLKLLDDLFTRFGKYGMLSSSASLPWSQNA